MSSSVTRGGSKATFAAGVLVFTLALFWPMLINGGPLLFFDTPTYLNQGYEAVSWVTGKLGIGAGEAAVAVDAASGAAAATGEDVAAAGGAPEVRAIRSVPYAIFSYLAILTPLGTYGLALAQTLMVVAPLVAIVLAAEPEARPRGPLAIGGLALVALTSVAFFTSFLMPDVLAAVVVLYAMALVRGFDEAGFVLRLVLAGVACFAIASHYGHVPVAFAVLVVAVALRWLSSRSSGWMVAAAVLPFVLAIGFNAALGVVVSGGASIAPKRLPLLIARSIEDGPGYRYLIEACPTENYAICEHFDVLPDNIQDVMWEPGGIGDASGEMIARIRDEELHVIWEIFKRYPAEQTTALIGNSLAQFFALGTENLHRGTMRFTAQDGYRVDMRRGEPSPVIDALGVIHVLSVIVGALAIVWLAFTGPGLRPRDRDMVLVLLVGLLANAAVFGGLSAPVDRYQSRLAWIVPFVAMLLWMERRARREREARDVREGVIAA